MEIQLKLNEEKEKYEHAICTYEGNDPIDLHFENIKWLEENYSKHKSDDNLSTFIEETVNKFKNNSKYKQDPRFVQILVSFIENHSNAAECYQTMYNKKLGTMCSAFYLAWANLFDQNNDFKSVDKILLLGIKSKAEPLKELKEAHIKFQLSLARRMLNGQLSTDEKEIQEVGNRQAFKVIKKPKIQSVIKHSLDHCVKKKTSVKDDNEKKNNGVHAVFSSKENLKPKKYHSKLPLPVSLANVEDFQDNNVNFVTKLSGITEPTLYNVKPSANIFCPVAVFEPLDPFKRPMYCKNKVYAAGKDLQIEEIRYELYLKEEKLKENNNLLSSNFKCPLNENAVKISKKIILPDNNVKSNNFQVKTSVCKESNTLSESVTANTRAAIDLVQQMWNSPCKESIDKFISKEPNLFNEIGECDNNIQMKCPSDILVYEDNKLSAIEKESDNVLKTQIKKKIKIKEDFLVYTDEHGIDDKVKCYKINVDNVAHQVEYNSSYEVHIDKNDKYSTPDMFATNLNNKNANDFEILSDKNVKNEKPSFRDTENIENDDNLTSLTEAFQFVLTSSTPLSAKNSKPRNMQIEKLEKNNPVIKNLSMILEGSKERNNSSAEIISTNQKSTINFRKNL